jgi:hypothetical protein
MLPPPETTGGRGIYAIDCERAEFAERSERSEPVNDESEAS